MKKLAPIFAALMFISLCTFAVDSDEVNSKIKAAFQQSFSAASDVKWEKSGSVYFVSFKSEGQVLSAVYNEAGELKSSSRTMPLSQLPLKILFSLQEKYSGYTIENSVSEVFSNNETNYYLTAENEKNKLKLQADASGNFNVEEKIKKK